MKITTRWQYHSLWLLLLVLLTGFRSLDAATNPTRIALVIGNADYSEDRLKNPTNDADLMTRTLESKGFKVTMLKNATKRQMKQGIRNFTRSLDEQSIGLFYFAGHGVEFDGNNYLIPIDADIGGEEDVEYEGVNVGRLLNGLKQSNNGLNLVILDACRNNPYASSFRSVTRGLSRMQPASGSLIIYATEPGNVAEDGSGNNGVFTRHLVDAINQQGQSIERVFKITAINVSKATGKRQTPYIEGVVLGEFYFSGKQSASTPPAVTGISSGTSSDEHNFWREIKADQSAVMYQAYLEQYPNGLYAPIAKIRIEQALKQSTNHKAETSQNSGAVEITSDQTRKETGDIYLRENAGKQGVRVTDSGLQYSVITQGNGAKPSATDRVTVHYRGTLIDGTEFDSSYARGEPASFGLNQVIPGWTEGLQLMSTGSKFKLVLPYALGYGKRGAGGTIGPFETLIYEVELIDFK